MAEKLVEQAEACLILSDFARAESASKDALAELGGLDHHERPSLLAEQACSIFIQALFEQGR